MRNYHSIHFCALFCHLLIEMETNQNVKSDIYRTFLDLEARKSTNTKLTNSVRLLKILITITEYHDNNYIHTTFDIS